MYNLELRKKVVQLLKPWCGYNEDVKDSILLRVYITVKMMQVVGIAIPGKAYEQVRKNAAAFEFAVLKLDRFPASEEMQVIYKGLGSISLRDYLTYVVPESVCDPHRTVSLLEKHLPEKSEAEWIHHIIQIRRLGYQVNSFMRSMDGESTENFLDRLYSVYSGLEKGTPLPKDLFLKLYSAINAFELRSGELQPSAIGFSATELENLMSILTDELQMTRAQQIELVARFFISKDQAAQIIDDETLYNFIVCKDRKARTKKVNKALRLIAKIPPLELLCAISTRKKASSVSVTKRTEGLLLANDVTLENGFVYPLFKNNIGYGEDSAILLMYPSMHFIRKLFDDTSMRDRKLTIVMQDRNEVKLLMYQTEHAPYAWRLGERIRFESDKEFDLNHCNYDKIFLFGNNLPLAQQQTTLRKMIATLKGHADLYALMSSVVAEEAGLRFGEPTDPFIQRLRTIALIPQGINNSTHPRRKIWIHCNGAAETIMQRYFTIHSFTLDTTMKTQAISRMENGRLNLDRSKISDLPGSIRNKFSEELMARRAVGRTRNMAFSHEITPDIPVWCSRSFPKGLEGHPRLEAYVCLPPEEENKYRYYPDKGEVIQSTKKHTTSVPRTDIVDWLENVYPFSTVQQRHTAAQIKELGTEYALKPAISIRDEIIQRYTPILKGQNIAFRTFWYIYPNLKDYYRESDYQVLCQLMGTVIGQLRLRDVTSDICENLLMELEPDVPETVLWRNYTILSVAMEKAVSFGYCKENPLEDALRDRKLRNKLFAQVRKQLVKKHLTMPEFRRLLQSVLKKIQEGKYEYVGVLIRLLTGLESNIVCALRWCDLCSATSFVGKFFVITRQLSNDGKEVSGFSDAEDYVCYPVSALLDELLMEFKERLPGVSDKEQIVNSILRLYVPATKKYITPSKLTALTKETIKDLEIADNYFNLAYDERTFRKINLNKYVGDFVRENFRYWATEVAQLNPDELAYLLRNSAPSTLGHYYCDFMSESALVAIAEKLSRIERALLQSKPPAARRFAKKRTNRCSFSTKSEDGYRKKVSMELYGQAPMEVKADSPFGVTIVATELMEEEGEWN